MFTYTFTDWGEPITIVYNPEEELPWSFGTLSARYLLILLASIYRGDAFVVIERWHTAMNAFEMDAFEKETGGGDE